MSTPSTPAEDPVSRTRVLGIAAAISAITAVGTALSLGLPLLAIVLEGRGFSSSAIGWNTAMAGIAALAVTPFAPGLAHRIGAARLLFLVLVVATLTFPLFYLVESYAGWFVLRFLFHGCTVVAFVLSEFWINALAPAGRRGLVMGIYSTVLAVGFAVGPAILGLVGSAGPAPFVIGTFVLAVATLPVLLALKANPPMEKRPRGSILGFVTLVPMATFAALVMGANESGVMSFIAIYGLKLGYVEATAALFVSAFALGNVVSQVPLGLLADRVDRRRLLFAIAASSTVLALLIPVVAGWPPLLLAVVAMWGGVVAGLYTVGLTHLGARLSGTDLASANAAFVLMYAVGMLIGPAAMGASMDAFGPHGMIAVSAALTFAYALLAIGRIASGARG